MFKITEKNIDIILNVLINIKLNDYQKDKIKINLFSNFMTPLGALDCIARIIDENNLKYISMNNIHAIDRGDPYKKTIVSYKDNYFWAAYAEFIENDIDLYNTVESLMEGLK